MIRSAPLSWETVAAVAAALVKFNLIRRADPNKTSHWEILT